MLILTLACSSLTHLDLNMVDLYIIPFDLNMLTLTASSMATVLVIDNSDLIGVSSFEVV